MGTEWCNLSSFGWLLELLQVWPKKLIFGIDLQKVDRANHIMSSKKWLNDFGFGKGPKK